MRVLLEQYGAQTTQAHEFLQLHELRVVILRKLNKSLSFSIAYVDSGKFEANGHEAAFLLSQGN